MRTTSIAALITALLASSAALADSNSDFLSANAKKPGVKVVAGGLQYKVIKTGHGAKPGSTDCATVNYKGSFPDGRVFDESKPGEPITFPVQRVIKGWTMALQMMHEGDQWQLVIPSTLGYGDMGTPGGPIPPGATLVFDVELLKVSKSKMGRCPA
ncbi:MAG TPA: FKBP-type peptidyl-prolyl cis-trans isomerase [Rhizomicrobium sp.]|jgi:FKBP-type peptidyl-prolyl cis-trans isomerase|nr:FKBP-type peptidyl-prolyl cis-trans isomerase [Rhizomicrobium sp.]